MLPSIEFANSLTHLGELKTKLINSNVLNNFVINELKTNGLYFKDILKQFVSLQIYERIIRIQSQSIT